MRGNTIRIPSESITESLAVDFNIETHRNQIIRSWTAMNWCILQLVRRDLRIGRELGFSGTYILNLTGFLEDVSGNFMIFSWSSLAIRYKHVLYYRILGFLLSALTEIFRSNERIFSLRQRRFLMGFHRKNGPVAQFHSGYFSISNFLVTSNVVSVSV